MALSGKTVVQVEIKSDGYAFYELWKAHQYQIPALSPASIQNCQPLDGDVGTVGSVLFWNYYHDGKDRVAKTLIIDIDEDKRSITFQNLEGDLLELYRTIAVNVNVETNGLNNVVTWTAEYEKLTPDVPAPDTLMEFCKNLTKDIETQHLKV